MYILDNIQKNGYLLNKGKNMEEDSEKNGGY